VPLLVILGSRRQALISSEAGMLTGPVHTPSYVKAIKDELLPSNYCINLRMGSKEPLCFYRDPNSTISELLLAYGK